MSRRASEKSVIDDIIRLLVLTPVWVGPILAVAAFALFRFLIPTFFPPKKDGFDAGILFRQIMPMVSWIVGGAILAIWLIAEFHKLRNRQLLDSRSDLESLRD